MFRKYLLVLVSFFILLGAGCNVPAQSSSADDAQNFLISKIAVTSTADSQVESEKIGDVESTCSLPTIGAELGNIFKDCQLKELEKGSGYSQTFNPEGANGIFDYCNTLVFRHYESLKGDIYTYEKVRYTHIPNSEVGEYITSKDIFDSITNSRPCIATDNRFDSLSDDELSADLFPSRNYELRKDLPDINVLPSKFVVQKPVPVEPSKEVIPAYAPNGTYTNSVGNEVPSPYVAPSAPAGASARCRDGTYSFSQSRRGTCSHHGGVDEWL